MRTRRGTSSPIITPSTRRCRQFRRRRRNKGSAARLLGRGFADDVLRIGSGLLLIEDGLLAGRLRTVVRSIPGRVAGSLLAGRSVRGSRGGRGRERLGRI